MRIVIDTNLWVAGLLWKGLPWELLRLVEAKEVELCMAPAMTLERGWAEDLPFDRWLNERIWVAESALDEEDV